MKDKQIINVFNSFLTFTTVCRYLTLSQNELRTLPCSLMQCRLEYLDLSCNQFDNPTGKDKLAEHTLWDFYVTSLVHISAKVVLKNKFHYAPNIIPRTLVDFLDNANMCVCGKPVLNISYYIIKQFELKDFFRVVVFNSDRNCVYGFECYFCSPKCFMK